MWLKSVRIENIKCFSELELILTPPPFASKNGHQPFRWVTLLGENGVGKSTILQAIGLLLAGADAAKELLPRPTGWVRDRSKVGKLSATLYQEEGEANDTLPSEGSEASDAGTYGGSESVCPHFSFSYAYFVTGDKPVKVPVKAGQNKRAEIYTEPALVEQSSPVLSWLRTNAFASGTKGWFAVGYGSFRRLTRTNQIWLPILDIPTRASNFITLFDEDHALSSFERFLVYLDYRIAKDPSDYEAKRMEAISKKAILSLLPGEIEIAGITKMGMIEFKINNQHVPTIALSDGFRSLIALAGDLIWRLQQAFPNLDNPTQARGVVLIDELDIHLHPIWQRDIANWLRDAFPNLQFIVTAHSPLVAIGAGEEALTLRFRAEEGNIKVERIDKISAYDVDRVLRSPAFGLVSTHSPETEEKIEQYHELRRRLPDLEAQEKKRLEELTEFMREAQPLDDLPQPGSLLDRMNRFLDENLP